MQNQMNNRVSNMDRRQFLTHAAAGGAALAASPLAASVTLAQAPWENRLVVIILRGAMDGLEVVRPAGDALFDRYRPTLARKAGMDLDGYFALHDRLAPLMPLWRAGQLGFAHAVATPYRDKRSHFDGQDLLEAGTVALKGAGRDGWLNRMLGQVPGVTVKTAFAVGPGDMLVLSGGVPTSSWSPAARLDLSERGRRLLEVLYHDDPVFQEAGRVALEMTGDVLGQDEAPEKAVDNRIMRMLAQGRRATRAGALARFTARRLNEDTRIAAFSINGWDTHRAQSGGIRRPLGELADALLELKRGLGANWDRTVVMAMTEFGRTVRENGSRGTDHGTGGVMVMAGGALKGGRVYGRWPGLGEGDLYQNRDLLPTSDVRAYAAYAMRGLFGLDRGLLERVVFPGLEMGEDPGITA